MIQELQGEDAAQRHADLKLKVRGALLVYSRMPDVDARYRQGLHASGWIFKAIREPGEYGRHPVWLKKVASPKEITEMEAVMVWLAWLRRQEGEGEPAIRRIIGWATGTPMFVLAYRERRSVRTIHNRIDCSIAKMLLEFFAIVADVASIVELAKPEHAMSFTDRPTQAGSPDSIEPGRVYIAGKGMMVHGEAEREGNAVDRMMARRKRRG